MLSTRTRLAVDSVIALIKGNKRPSRVLGNIKMAKLRYGLCSRIGKNPSPHPTGSTPLQVCLCRVSRVLCKVVCDAVLTKQKLTQLGRDRPLALAMPRHDLTPSVGWRAICHLPAKKTVCRRY